MQQRRKVRERGHASLILVGIGLSLVFWFLEALVDVLVFDNADLVGAIFAPQSHEVWMRLTVIALFMAFALYSNSMVEARRRAEDAAKRANAEVSQIFETAADGMRVVDRNFIVLRANDTFAELVGLPKQDILGKKCYEVFRGDLCDTRDCPLTRVLNGEDRVEYEVNAEPSDILVDEDLSIAVFRIFQEATHQCDPACESDGRGDQAHGVRGNPPTWSLPERPPTATRSSNWCATNRTGTWCCWTSPCPAAAESTR